MSPATYNYVICRVQTTVETKKFKDFQGS